MNLKKMIRYLCDSGYRFAVNDSHGIYIRLSDEEYLKRKFYSKFGRRLNLNSPKTFNEKMQWLKLNDRRPEYQTMVDKHAVKGYVAGIIGEEYIIPTLGVWNSFDDIDFSVLPDQFVLKCTHDSGGLVICKDKCFFDINKARKKINISLHTDYYLRGREWPYKNVPKRIICEKYMEDSNTGELADYKIHCFNGIPKLILVCKNRFSRDGMTEDFFTDKWEHIPVTRETHPNSMEDIPKPDLLDEMLSLAKRLSNGIPFVRIDFYTINQSVYFGELTFFPASGFGKFIPDKWDLNLGKMLKLPQ